MVMNNARFGKSNWEEEIKQGRPGGQKKDVYTRLEPGNNILRLVTIPYQYYAHKYKEEGDAGFGDKVACSMPLHKSCPLCALKDKPKRRWYVGVINRTQKRFEILDISVSVYKHLQELSRDESWGDPTTYDINIKVDKDGGATGYYTVIARPKTPLSEEDLAIKKSVVEEDLVRKCTPPEPKWVLDRINFFRDKKGKAPLVVDLAASNGAAETVNVDMSAEAPETFDFTAHD